MDINIVDLTHYEKINIIDKILIEIMIIDTVEMLKNKCSSPKTKTTYTVPEIPAFSEVYSFFILDTVDFSSKINEIDKEII